MRHFFSFIFLIICHLSTAQSPNFVFILADDMGWNGTSVQISGTEPGSVSDFYETPNLAQMATDGMTFSQAYAPAAKCSPTRCSILNGKSTARNRFTETGNVNSPGEILIHPTTITALPTADMSLAEWLALTGLNYRKAHFGKWHLAAGGPEAHGFDVSDGATSNEDGDATDGLVIQTNPKKINDLTASSLQFIQDAVTDNVPFYLQISHYAVHEDVETTQSSFDFFTAKTPGAVHDNISYAGMMKDMDASINAIRTELTNLGIAGNTYVIFTSDNGGANVMSSNTPLRRGKSFIYEGGIRVPMFVVGPGIVAGSSSAEPVVGYDLYPTIADLTGSTAALPTDLDGQSIVPILEQTTFSRTAPLYFHIPHYGTNAAKSPRSAVVDGKYKLIIEYETGIDYLYDLDANISEDTNIAGANPALLLSMKIKLRDHFKTVATIMPTLNPDHANFSGTAPDIDSDGLEDEWEFRELLSYIYGPTDDPDGDGMDNLTEYNNGTDPLVDQTILAVLENFELQAKIYENESILLSWHHSNDLSLDYFEMEKLSDGGQWETIGTIAQTNNQFIDKYPNFGQNYYRLKIVNTDETSDYSLTARVDFSRENLIQFFPNPTNGLMQISFPQHGLLTGKIDILIYNSVGALVQEIQTEKQTIMEINLRNQADGIYFIQILEKGQSLVYTRLTLAR